MKASLSAEAATKRQSSKAASLMEEVEMEVASQEEDELFPNTLEQTDVDRLAKTDAWLLPSQLE